MIAARSVDSGLETRERRVGLFEQARAAASFLNTSYKTRGKREGQQNTFPEFVAAIQAEKSKTGSGI